MMIIISTDLTSIWILKGPALNLRVGLGDRLEKVVKLGRVCNQQETHLALHTETLGSSQPIDVK